MVRAAAAREHGFTLLELGLTVALIGLLVTLVVPRLGLIGGASLQASARQLASRIELLREDAALRGRTVRLSFDAKGRRYGAEVLIDAHTGDGPRFVADEAPLFRTVTLPDSIQIDLDGPGLMTTRDGHQAALFAADGYTDPLVIRLSNGPQQIYSIVVEPARSRPRLVDGVIDVRSTMEASAGTSTIGTMGRRR
jgi:type II secretion system protein H